MLLGWGKKRQRIFKLFHLSSKSRSGEKCVSRKNHASERDLHIIKLFFIIFYSSLLSNNWKWQNALSIASLKLSRQQQTNLLKFFSVFRAFVTFSCSHFLLLPFSDTDKDSLRHRGTFIRIACLARLEVEVKSSQKQMQQKRRRRKNVSFCTTK